MAKSSNTQKNFSYGFLVCVFFLSNISPLQADGVVGVGASLRDPAQIAPAEAALNVQPQKSIPNPNIDEDGPLSASDAMMAGLQTPDSSFTEANAINRSKRELAGEGVTVRKLEWESVETRDGFLAVRGTATTYPGSSYLFIYDDTGKRLLRYDTDVFKPTRQIYIEDTGNAAFILEGNNYTDAFGHLIKGTMKVFSLDGSGSLLHSVAVEQMGTSITDTEGSRITIWSYKEYKEGRFGIRQVLDVTPAKVRVIHSNDKLIPKNRLNQLPETESNSDYVYRVFKHRLDGSDDTYEVFNKITGDYIGSVVKHSRPPTQGGTFIDALVVPDVSKNGRYLVTSFSEKCNIASSSCTYVTQNFVVKDLQTNTVTRVSLKNKADSAVVVTHFINKPGQGLRIEVIYDDGSKAYYNPANPSVITEASWRKQAPSNVNFSFSSSVRLRPDGSYEHMLYLTQAGVASTRVLSQIMTANAETPFTLMDVTPDGTQYVMAHKAGKTASGNPVTASLYINRTDSSEGPSYSQTGVFTSVKITDTRITLTRRDGTKFIIDRKTLKVIQVIRV